MASRVPQGLHLGYQRTGKSIKGNRPPSLPPSKTRPRRGARWTRLRGERVLSLPFTASRSTHGFSSSTGSGVSILAGGGGGKARRELRGHGHCGGCGGARELGKIQGPNVRVEGGISELARWAGEVGRKKFAEGLVGDGVESGQGRSFSSVFLRWRESKSWSLNAEGGPLFRNVTQPVTLFVPEQPRGGTGHPSALIPRLQDALGGGTCTLKCELTGNAALSAQ